MKKKLSLFLVVSLLLLTCAGSAASSKINLYVNGSLLYPDVPPQIIDGRTMVPIRFIGEALNCDVQWNESINSVSISNAKPLETPVIEGTGEFKEIINGVLDLAKKNDTSLYNWYISNVDIIKLGYANGYPAMNNINTATNETTIVFSESHFNIVKTKYPKEDQILLYTGTLAHECCHTSFRHKHIYTDSDEEALCWIAAVRAFEKVGGNNTEFEKYFKDSVYDQLKL